MVFALGEVGYDFGTEARLEYFGQQLGGRAGASDPLRMVSYLRAEASTEKLEEGRLDEGLPDRGRQEDAAALLWTLNIEATPIYAIVPDDAFAVKAYGLLVSFLHDQCVDQGHEGGDGTAAPSRSTGPRDSLYRVAVAGRLQGNATLFDGTVVPVLRPVTRGLFNWNLDALLGAALVERRNHGGVAALEGFLRRIYFELHNLGQSSSDRALNFAGTNVYNAGRIFLAAWRDGLTGLERFDVKRSRLCRPEADCWDVEMTFFAPENPYRRARRVYRQTIDVSDVIPVAVGRPLSWPTNSAPPR
ncbi:MAG: hypothetical protein AAGF23_15530 [Acidobacteriota bacterium]